MLKRKLLMLERTLRQTEANTASAGRARSLFSGTTAEMTYRAGTSTRLQDEIADVDSADRLSSHSARRPSNRDNIKRSPGVSHPSQPRTDGKIGLSDRGAALGYVNRCLSDVEGGYYDPLPGRPL